MRFAIDFVCISHLRWDFVLQRPQHLMARCAREARVLFVEEPVFGAYGPHMRVREDRTGVRIAVPFLPEGLSLREQDDVQRGLLDDVLQRVDFRRFVLWYYTPMAVGFSRHLRPVATVFDSMDELSAFADAPQELREREGELLDSADLVFAGGQSLYEAKRERHRHVHLFPSSVDRDHFARARGDLLDPEDQAGIPHPRLGYFGVVDERMDAELLAGVAIARPDWSLVVVGPVVKIDPARLPAAPNIRYLGMKSYAELPRYLAGWDVAMMPFAHNDSTRFISPTKTPEYLSAGKPVVSTSITDVVRPYGELGLVHVGDGPEGFVRAAQAAMAEDAAERVRRADEFLSGTSWDATWRRMRELIDETVAERERRDSVTVVLGDDGGAVENAATGNRIRPPRTSALDDGGTVAPVPRRGFDFLIVGAGFAGSVLAERLANEAGKRVLVVERRNHVGGNAYDRFDEHGILVHVYGPHIFHTNSREVFEYLSQFTEWRPYEHRVLASVDGQLLPMPINLDTINRLYNVNLSSFELQEFLAARAESRIPVRTSEDVVVGKVGRELYEKFFRGYTRKQWGLDPSELDATVTSRVPTRTTRDDRYFTDTFQAMPAHGYTRMFERMLDHPNIKVMLNTDYREVSDLVPYREVVYTGPVDEFFGCRYGRLPYRSLQFRFETLPVERAQSAAVVNYPNDHLYTRVTEFKYLTGQEHPKTTLVYEYPRSDGDPYYPVPRPENGALYRRYKALADATPGVHFVGRLATYKYYNMDQVVAQSLAVYRRIVEARRPADGNEQGDTAATAAARDERDGAEPQGDVLARRPSS